MRKHADDAARAQVGHVGRGRAPGAEVAIDELRTLREMARSIAQQTHSSIEDLADAGPETVAEILIGRLREMASLTNRANAVAVIDSLPRPG